MEHDFNLWFVISALNAEQLNGCGRSARPFAALRLSMRHAYHIDLS
jgi:hypothetical protein